MKLTKDQIKQRSKLIAMSAKLYFHYNEIPLNKRQEIIDLLESVELQKPIY